PASSYWPDLACGIGSTRANGCRKLKCTGPRPWAPGAIRTMSALPRLPRRLAGNLGLSSRTPLEGLLAPAVRQPGERLTRFLGDRRIVVDLKRLERFHDGPSLDVHLHERPDALEADHRRGIELRGENETIDRFRVAPRVDACQLARGPGPLLGM